MKWVMANPLRARFPNGRSGNPKGRPRGSRSSATLLGEILSERVAVRENGRVRTVTKKELILRYAVNKAAMGDSRAREFLASRTPWLQREFAEPKRSQISEIEAFEKAREILRGAL
jgi:uracil-DNA glycosylase